MTDFGGDLVLSHFTNAQGVKGITGIGELAVGEEAVVHNLRFGTGANSFMSEAEGDVFITPALSSDATPGQLMQIGVFGDKQNYVIQFSKEAAYWNGVDIYRPLPSIWSIPANTSMQGVFRVIRLR